MKIWTRFPFVRLVLPLIAGILLNRFLPVDISKPLFAATFLLAALLILLRVTGLDGRSYRYRWIFGILLNLTVIFLGYDLSVLHNELNAKSHFAHFAGEEGVVLSGTLTEPPSERANSYRAVVKMDRMSAGGELKTVSGKLMVYFAKDSLARSLQYGDRILFSASPVRVGPPGNPGEFDYAGYLANKAIYHQVFLKQGSYLVSAEKGGNPLRALAFRARESFLHIFEAYGIAGKEFAVAAALIIGYSERLDPELRREFSGSGAMHILCVSGLHVGIIFLMADKFFFFLGKRKKGRYLKPALIILVIWFYALITGLAPSVMRASLMFSLVAVKGALSRESHIFNTLAASAFILLVINPSFLFEVGFQLSYFAVAGIVIFQPHFAGLWVTQSKVVKYIRDILLVSLAAQLVTGPLSVLYFHQFPNYFLLTNLLVIPFAGILIYSGVIFLVFSFIPLLGKVAAMVLVAEIKALNGVVAFIEGAPHAVSRNLFLPGFSAVLIYVLLFAALGWLLTRERRWLAAALSAAVLIAADYSMLGIRRARQQMMIVHNLNRHSVVSVVNGSSHLILADSAVINDPSQLNYPLEGFRIEAGLDEPQFAALAAGSAENAACRFRNGFLWFNGNRLAIITPAFRKPPEGRTLRVDYVILTSDARLTAGELAGYFPGARYIADASNSFRRTRQWKADFENLGIPFYDTREQGAMVIRSEKKPVRL